MRIASVLNKIVTMFKPTLLLLVFLAFALGASCEQIEPETSPSSPSSPSSPGSDFLGVLLKMALSAMAKANSTTTNDTSLSILDMLRSPQRPAEDHDDHESYYLNDGELNDRGRSISRSTTSTSIFSDIYALFIKILGTLTQPFGNIFGNLWGLVTFYPKMILKLFNLAGLLGNAVFKMMFRGGYSWLKVQQIIIDLISGFQRELLDVLRTIFFPAGVD